MNCSLEIVAAIAIYTGNKKLSHPTRTRERLTRYHLVSRPAIDKCLALQSAITGCPVLAYPAACEIVADLQPKYSWATFGGAILRGFQNLPSLSGGSHPLTAPIRRIYYMNLADSIAIGHLPVKPYLSWDIEAKEIE
jgi:hypothetical protein